MFIYYLLPIALFAFISYGSHFIPATFDVLEDKTVFFWQWTGIYLVALAVSFLMISFFSSHAEKYGLIDHPDGKRKIHSTSKPLVGGIGIFTGLLVSMFLFMPFWENLGIITAIIMIVTIGALDDMRDLSFKTRFLVQSGAAVSSMYFGGTVLHSFGDILGGGAVQTGFLALPITLFCIIGIINAVNMIDGLDGLAGGFSLVSITAFGILAWLNNQPQLVFISIALIGSLSAFLHFNWFPSKLFMGDAGSMTLGFVLAFFAIEITQKTGSIISPAATLLVVALPVSDTITVMTKRILKGQNPFHPDKNHIHHTIKAMGFSHQKVVILIILATVISSCIAVFGTLMHFPDHLFFIIFLFCFTVYLVASYKLKTIYRYLTWLRQQKILDIHLNDVLR